ncbi:replication initiation and membrane attachment family protein [Terribacillus saccharophilus]|uniref:DnaD domain protein n=1 Tax=Terribacillus saccharophilus TaxID=361277 RepID=UPI002989DF71|nr:DnaD domain protein [Terribacillus saccharophilus]MCM3227535.1 DnaD domain protein [Terribacillus saccharophilus]
MSNSEKTNQLIDLFNNISPYQLVNDMRTISITDEEKELIERIKQIHSLPDSVVNVLLHYVILKISPELSTKKETIEEIAKHWSGLNVSSVEFAMNMIRSERRLYNDWFNQTKAKKSNEVIPDWFKNNQDSPTQQPIDPNLDIAAMIKELNDWKKNK